MKTSKGFSAVEGLVVLVVVVIVGFGGWHVLHGHKKANSKNSTSAQSQNSTNSNSDPTAGWVSYSSAQGLFSLKYPKTWATAANPQNCGGSLLLLGGDTNSVGACGADGPQAAGQMQISSEAGDERAGLAFKTGYTNIGTINVTLNGVQGIEQSATASGQGEQGFADGTKFIQYIFYANGKTYLASYVNGYNYPDVSADFTTMVTKTWKFSAN